MTPAPGAAAPVLILTLACPDRIGIVADVARFLADRGCNVLESAQYEDDALGRFLMRTVFSVGEGVTLDALAEAFQPIAQRYQMRFDLFDQSEKVRALILVSRFGHCLNDLVFRTQSGALPIEITGVASNHEDFRRLTEHAALPFHHLPVSPETKAAQEAALSRLVAETGSELIVLARYMQVLSPDFCTRHAGRIINIHHSFLPSFKGARPYHRAHARGVKLIGATAHFVTDDLDEGPIIEQGVERVSHRLSAEDFVAVGRDIEALVLARAVKWYAERRILLSGARTVVFS